jgi:diketogulonate reductase-like aldo/keto reductase
MATGRPTANSATPTSALTNTLQLGVPAEPWPTLGLGTWRFGESERKASDEVSAIRRALEIGYRLFDTAEMYGDGGAERVLGRALHDAMQHDQGLRREQLRIVSKAYPHHADVAGLQRACDASRKRLQLDTIDLYLLHWRGNVPLADTLRGFEQLLSKGWIRRWGVSNFDVADLEELRALDGGAACAANQVYYSISERGVEFDLLPHMRQWQMPLMAYTPIDSGRIGQHAELAALAADLQVAAASARRDGDSQSGARGAPARELARASATAGARDPVGTGHDVPQAQAQTAVVHALGPRSASPWRAAFSPRP